MRQRSGNRRKGFKVAILGVMVVSMNFTTGCAIIGAILQIVSAALSISPATRGAGQIVGMVGRVAQQSGGRLRSVTGTPRGTSRRSVGASTPRRASGRSGLQRLGY